MSSLSKEQAYALEVYSHIATMFDHEDENFRYDLNEVDLTALFTALILAHHTLYKRITDDDADLIDFIGIQNKLVFQYLKDNGKEMADEDSID